MAERSTDGTRGIVRDAYIFWSDQGNGGSGHLSSGRGAFGAVPISAGPGADLAHGTVSPGELLTAAHGASFVITLAALLARRSIPVRELAINAACTLSTDGSGVREITALELRVRARGQRADARPFVECADVALACCPISHALSPSVPITLDARYVEDG